MSRGTQVGVASLGMQIMRGERYTLLGHPIAGYR